MLAARAGAIRARRDRIPSATPEPPCFSLRCHAGFKTSTGQAGKLNKLNGGAARVIFRC